MTDPLSPLLLRHSIPARQLGEPAPDPATLQRLLTAAIRVPDHGKLAPFRLITLRGESKLRFGEQLADLALHRDPDMSDSKREKERQRYVYAPLVVVVIACINQETKVPPREQQLTAGCVAQNLLIGATALGFGAQWLTGWAAYDSDVAALLRLRENEQIIAFMHLGTPQIEVPDRDRPSLDDLLSEWTA